MAEMVASTEIPETICVSVIDAETREQLYLLLDESGNTREDKFREAFEEAKRTFPNRKIGVLRVPLSAWEEI